MLGGQAAKQRTRQFHLAGAEESVNPQHLAGAHVERHVLIRASPAELLNLQHRLGARPAVQWDVGEIALLQPFVSGADHAVDDPALVDGGTGLCRDRLAVAEYRYAVADRQHIIEEVGDEHDAAAGLAEAVQQGEQAVHLRRR